ncbi:MAG: DUF4147 domain-containing protein [Erysipelotrichaceae bacterium]|nr:DUF4147 domain-containing protein [Erysipelotrichaceae bacterium]
MILKEDVDIIIKRIVSDINPYKNTFMALNLDGDISNLYVIAIGKAAWTMAKAASDKFGNKITRGIVITKYHHSKGDIDNFDIYEAGHPIVDENSLIATNKVLELTNNLDRNDRVIFLVSGGGSALFEKPFISLQELQEINNQLLKSGATINEINKIRKRLSMVKGGKFAKHCLPASVDAYILSDVIGDDISSIASGPTANDSTTIDEIKEIINKYNIKIDEKYLKYLYTESINDVDNVTNCFVGSLKQLCDSTKNVCEELGYETIVVEDYYTGDGDLLAKGLGEYAIKKQEVDHCLAYIIGGEAIINVVGNGLGGRNQEIALRAALYLKECKDTCVFCFGSDGTDGPTDAAGAYSDEHTYDEIKGIEDYLNNNDAYNAFKTNDGLIMTGPTGTNVNDIYVLLIKR